MNPAGKTELRTVDDFIAFFTKIPEEKWVTGWVGIVENSDGCYCVLGHLGRRGVPEYGGRITESRNDQAFSNLLWSHNWSPAFINDGLAPYCPLQFRNLPTPRARILAALNAIKANQEKK